MEFDLVQAGPIRIPLSEIRFQFSRSGGPGGQNVNKVESRVTLRFSLRDSAFVSSPWKERALSRLQSRLTNDGELVISSNRSRSQWQNKSDCIQKLREILEEAFRPPRVRKKTKPGKASKARRLDSKKRHSEKKRSRRHNEED